jgi:hypothetical protein
MSGVPPEIHVGVLLEESTEMPGGGSSGHAEAWGYRGDHTLDRGNRVVQVGQDVLRAAGLAVGREVATVVAGVVAGIERPASTDGDEDSGALRHNSALGTGSFTIDNLELTFGVKATLGLGQVVTALLTASSEATVEVKLTLGHRKV